MVSVTLTSSMRSNLQSLKRTDLLQAKTQERVATGKKVNSALDNPTSYYTASSLKHRASDLGSLLDSMGQAIQNLQGVASTLETASKFLEQAAVVGNKALEKLENATYSNQFSIDKDWLVNNGVKAENIVTTKSELLNRLQTASAGDQIIIFGHIDLADQKIELKDGVSISGADRVIRDLGLEEWAHVDDADKGKLTFNNMSSADGIVMGNNSEISDLEISMISGGKIVGEGVINANNKSNVVLRNLSVDYKDTSGLAYQASAISAEGGSVSLYGDININTNGTSNTGIYAKNGIISQDEDSKLKMDIQGDSSYAIREGNINLTGDVDISISGSYIAGISDAQLVSSGSLSILIPVGSGGSAISKGSSVLSGKVSIATDGYSAHAIFNNKVTFKSDLVLLVKLNKTNASLVNNNSRALVSWEAGATIGIFNPTKNWDNVFQAGSGGSMNLGGDFNDLSLPPFSWKDVGTFPHDEFGKEMNDLYFIPFNVRAQGDNLKAISQLGLADGKISLEKEQKSFNGILKQYDELIKNSSYNGINLLLGQSLKIDFDEEHKSGILVKGAEASLSGMGMDYAEWTGLVALRASLDGLTKAVSKLRGFAEEFGNYNNIISTREDFTQSLIEVLTEGADKLTLADMNQESANILALQTRQQLAVNSLSLASEAAQSILKLF